LRQPKDFWAGVRTISQAAGYTERGRGRVKVPEVSEIKKALLERGLSTDYIITAGDKLTDRGKTLLAYFTYRAKILNEFVEPRLMNAGEARKLFRSLRARLKPRCPLPMNKQRGAKRTRAYLTCMINMIIEANARGMPCDYDPLELITVTRDGSPLRTLARRMDGAFPGTVNPVAAWEVKEYYHTTTFGSRVADGVYETLLDGMELQELREQADVDVKHYLMVDAHYTWWDCGRSYLCRIVDMLHMGYVDEVLFGREVVDRLPVLVKKWVALSRQRA